MPEAELVAADFAGKFRQHQQVTSGARVVEAQGVCTAVGDSSGYATVVVRRTGAGSEMREAVGHTCAGSLEVFVPGNFVSVAGGTESNGTHAAGVAIATDSTHTGRIGCVGVKACECVFGRVADGHELAIEIHSPGGLAAACRPVDGGSTTGDRRGVERNARNLGACVGKHNIYVVHEEGVACGVHRAVLRILPSEGMSTSGHLILVGIPSGQSAIGKLLLIVDQEDTLIIEGGSTFAIDAAEETNRTGGGEGKRSRNLGRGAGNA